jgi:spoIIIJ-associated protein
MLPSELEEIWGRTLDIIKNELSRPSFETWLKSTKLLEIDGKDVFIEVPNEFAKDLAVEFLTNVFRNMGLSVNMNCKTDNGYINISIKGTRLGILIGRRGETLDALQYLTNLAVNRKTEKRVNIILDVEGYRKRREETLNRLARRLAEKVKRTGNKVMLEPMNPHERRIIHTALQNNMDVTTYSEGEEPYRKVIIALKNAH